MQGVGSATVGETHSLGQACCATGKWHDGRGLQWGLHGGKGTLKMEMPE